MKWSAGRLSSVFLRRKNELRVGESKQDVEKSRVSRIVVFTDRFRVKLSNGVFSSRGEPEETQPSCTKSFCGDVLN